MKIEMQATNIKLNKRPACELGISLYIENMLSNPCFLQKFISTFSSDNDAILEDNFVIQEYEICPELPLSNYKADTCIFIKSESNTNYAILIESKLHYPSDEQLENNASFFKVIHGDYKVIPIHFLFSTENRQIAKAQKDNFKYPIVYLKEFINLYCSVAIENNFSMSYAYNLHEFVNNGNSISTPDYKLSTEQQYKILLGRSEKNGTESIFTGCHDGLYKLFNSKRCNQDNVVFVGKIVNSSKCVMYLFPEGDLDSSIKIGFHLEPFNQYFGVDRQDVENFFKTLDIPLKIGEWVDFSIKSKFDKSIFFNQLADWKETANCPL